jgi:hypothetical protein
LVYKIVADSQKPVQPSLFVDSWTADGSGAKQTSDPSVPVDLDQRVLEHLKKEGPQERDALAKALGVDTIDLARAIQRLEGQKRVVAKEGWIAIQ